MSQSGAAVSKAIRAAAARLLFLPTDRPDQNSVEQAFAKLKHQRRKAAERTDEAPWKRSSKLLDYFPPDECSQSLVNSGYASD